MFPGQYISNTKHHIFAFLCENIQNSEVALKQFCTGWFIGKLVLHSNILNDFFIFVVWNEIDWQVFSRPWELLTLNKNFAWKYQTLFTGKKVQLRTPPPLW